MIDNIIWKYRTIENYYSYNLLADEASVDVTKGTHNTIENNIYIVSLSLYSQTFT